MLERMIRSPLTMILYVIVLVTLMLVKVYTDFLADYETYFYCAALLIVLGFYLLIFIHNQKHPSRKIRSASLLKEEDEGMKWITYQACRKVYIFYSFSIPIGLVIIVLFRDYIITPLIVLGGMSITQYIIYWLEERKFLKSGSGKF